MTSIRIAGADQMVERRSITPTVLSRKLPCVAMSSGALDDRPNCHTAWDAYNVARRNGKSTDALSSAAAAKWMAITAQGEAETPVQVDAVRTLNNDLVSVRGPLLRASATTSRRKNGVPLTRRRWVDQDEHLHRDRRSVARARGSRHRQSPRRSAERQRGAGDHEQEDDRRRGRIGDQVTHSLREPAESVWSRIRRRRRSASSGTIAVFCRPIATERQAAERPALAEGYGEVSP